jgi:23S rRNA (cytosine1962-C5)-methyltransferase
LSPVKVARKGPPALDAGRTGRIIRRLTQAPDHPVESAFPEGAYLKGLEIVVE